MAASATVRLRTAGIVSLAALLAACPRELVGVRTGATCPLCRKPSVWTEGRLAYCMHCGTVLSRGVARRG
jgi:hypothetical protein